jgi:hypothetical protein
MKLTKSEIQGINTAHLTGQVWILQVLDNTRVRVIETRVKNKERLFKTINGEKIIAKDDMMLMRER